MKKLTPLYISILCALLALVFVSNTVMAANINVTFRLKLGVKTFKGNFSPASDSAWVKGDINGWSQTDDNKLVRQSSPNDTDYVIIQSVAEGSTMHYKYYTNHGGADWENNFPTGSGNREVTVGSNDTTIINWFNNDFFQTPPKLAVTFQCNARILLEEGAFRPDSGDHLTVTGSFNGWPNGGTDTLAPLAPPNDSIYARTDSIDGLQTIQYKFWKTSRKNHDWESVDNRSYGLDVSDVTIPVVYYDNDSVYKGPANGLWLWHTDMTLMEQLGIFDRLAVNPDTVRLRGALNSWSNGNGLNSLMARNPGSEGYELTTYFDGFAGDATPFKYYIQHDTTRAKIKFPSYIGNQDRYDYEHPVESGDGNRTQLAVNGNLTTPYYWYNGVHPDGFIPPGNTIHVTMQYDMRPAVASLGTSFVPGQDTVYLYLENFPWSSMQGYQQENSGLKFSDPDGDTIYTVTFDVVGPSDYSIMYRAHIVHNGGATADEQAGLGQSNPYHTRYIRPPFSNGQNYTLPLDTWKDVAPRYSEVPPFSDLAGSPTVTTLPLAGTSTSVDTMRALMNQNVGTYFANVGTAYFDYGTTSAYGSTSPTVALSAGSFSSPIAISAGHTYHYRAHAHVTGTDFITNEFPGLDQTFQVTSAKWNMVSVPYTQSDYSFASVYPGTESGAAYSFVPGSGYVSQPTLKNGVGYWVKWTSPALVALTGSPVTKVAVNVKTGWNLVGTPSDDVDATAITADAGGPVFGNQFFKYASGYVPVTTLQPYNAYWVKANHAGVLTIASPGVFSAAPKGTPTFVDALSKMNTLVITDANGNSQTLYYGRNSNDVKASAYELPPTPPAGVFDVRYGSGRMLELVDNAKTQTFPISVSTTAFPVTISWNVTSQNVIASLNTNGKPVVLSGKGSTKITSAAGLGLQLTGNAAIPTQFSLKQNYPNPFNPTTKITYDLPVDGKVKLALFNLIGQQVTVLVDEVQQAGFNKSVELNASNLPSGVYFYRLEAGKFNAVKKMVLLK